MLSVAAIWDQQPVRQSIDVKFRKPGRVFDLRITQMQQRRVLKMQFGFKRTPTRYTLPPDGTKALVTIMNRAPFSNLKHHSEVKLKQESRAAGNWVLVSIVRGTVFDDPTFQSALVTGNYECNLLLFESSNEGIRDTVNSIRGLALGGVASDPKGPRYFDMKATVLGRVLRDKRSPDLLAERLINGPDNEAGIRSKSTKADILRHGLDDIQRDVLREYLGGVNGKCSRARDRLEVARRLCSAPSSPPWS